MELKDMDDAFKLKVLDALCDGGLVPAAKVIQGRYTEMSLSDSCALAADIKREAGGN